MEWIHVNFTGGSLSQIVAGRLPGQATMIVESTNQFTKCQIMEDKKSMRFQTTQLSFGWLTTLQEMVLSRKEIFFEFLTIMHANQVRIAHSHMGRQLTEWSEASH